MSGGNHMRCTLAIALVALGLVALGLGGTMPASASNADGTPTEIGIATANIAWETPAEIDAVFADIHAAGFRHVRVGLKDPIDRSFAAMQRAKEAGLSVLVTFPLIDGAVAAKDAAPRARTGRFFAAYGLSQIDLDRFRARFDALLGFTARARIPLIGIELGNELNWSGYNGDLPMAATGQVIDSAEDWAPDTRRRFADGLDRYRAAMEIARGAIGSRPIKLISAGLADINADFISGSGATYVAPALTYAAFGERRIFDLSDAVGIHVYEPLRQANHHADRQAMIEAQLGPCGMSAFATRPCWITEFGSALPHRLCAADDAQRIHLLRPLLDRLAQSASAVPLAFYYDWNADKGFALERCGRPTGLVKALSDHNQIPAAP
ncbi:hypothetical protein [Dongia sp.]|uniref:hypothetical protein n=1 Tax=Dongia sp. TaxID=1977262 RepID=UPI0035B49A26